MSDTAQRRLLTVRDIALLAQVSEQTVRRWLRSGRLSGLHLGRSGSGWRVWSDTVERFLAGLEAETAQNTQKTP